ncbi:MAG TPA: sodium:proton antiporter [Thermoanaerobacterales bacterium]|nr:sodium:proton antiporter [Thermoanaerobacterales bacterium]
MDGATTYGIISLIPVAVIIIAAIITKKTFESMFLGVITAFVILGGGSLSKTFNLFLDSIYSVIMNENTVWVLLICGLFGSLTFLMEKSGGVLGFSTLTEKTIKSRKAALLGTWILGIVVFVDDYLNALVVGSAMRKITDKFKISREMLAYIINSTGVTVCAIVPFSTWAAFMSGLMENSDMTKGLSPIAAYMRTIPYMAYAWLAVILVPLFSLNIIPLFGPMKEAEERTLETGEVFSEISKEAFQDTADDEDIPVDPQKHRALNFLLPIILLAYLTIKTDDILLGLFAALGLCFLLYLPQRLMKFGEYFDSIIGGLTDMFPVLVLIILAYTIQEANSALGLTEYVISVTMDILNPALLPVIIFIVISFLAFTTGTFWGLAAISFPIVAPLAAAMNVDPFLCSGAVISAVAFGGHICLYSDTVILASASTRVTNVDYFKTSAPLVMVPFVLAVIIFLVLGFVM